MYSFINIMIKLSMLLGAYGLAPTWKFIDTPQVRTTAVDSHS